MYEAAAELQEIGAGVALHPNAMRVLRVHRRRGRRAEGRGAVRVRGHQGRDHRAADLQDEPGAGRGQLQGIEPATVHRADLLDVLAAALPAGLVSLGKRCVRAWTAAGRRRSRGSPTARTAEADVIIGADGIHSAVRTALFGPDAPRFTGKICYRSVIPAAAVRGGALPTGGRQRAVAGAARHDRALPAARRGADQRRRALRRRQLPARVMGDAVPSGPRCSSGTRDGTSRCCGCSRPGRPGTSGRCTTGTRSRPGRRGGSRCSATRRTRCCRTWGRAPARRSRTGRCWRTRCRPPAPRPIRSRRSRPVRADAAAAGVAGGPHRPGARRVQPPAVAGGPRSGGTSAIAVRQAAQPARHRRAGRGLAGRLRRDLARRAGSEAEGRADAVGSRGYGAIERETLDLGDASATRRRTWRG